MPSVSEMERQYQESQDTHGWPVEPGYGLEGKLVYDGYIANPHDGWMIIACVITLAFIAGICVGLTLGKLISG